jgi:hypothetical protein
MITEEQGVMLRIAEEQGALVRWLRAYPGFSPTSPTIPECIEQFPSLDRFQVDAAMRQVREEKAVEYEHPWFRPSDKAADFFLELWSGRTPEISDLSDEARQEVVRMIRALSPANRKPFRRYLRGRKSA